MLRDDLAHLELERLNAETQKLTNESRKFAAEERRLKREAFWYPFMVGSAAITSLAGLSAVLVTL